MLITAPKHRFGFKTGNMRVGRARQHCRHTRPPVTYQSVGGRSLRLLRDVGHIGEHDGEGDGEHAGYADGGEIPPDERTEQRPLERYGREGRETGKRQTYAKNS